jgi:hypothetical protein
MRLNEKKETDNILFSLASYLYFIVNVVATIILNESCEMRKKLVSVKVYLLQMPVQNNHCNVVTVVIKIFHF